MIGDNLGGGIVGYIFQPGDERYVVGEENMIVVSESDQDTGGIKWYNDTYSYKTGATESSYGSGQRNTDKIIATQGTASYAAYACDDLVIDEYSDWFLPSIGELGILYENRVAIGGGMEGVYWSSTEYELGPNYVRCIDFGSGLQVSRVKGYPAQIGIPNRVRAVRYHTVVIVVSTVPTVTSDDYGSLGNSNANVTGTIVSDGGSAILERGIVWSTSPNPTIADNKVAGTGTAVGTFTQTYTIPNPYTYIYVRSYATNAIGTGYGTDLYFILPCFVKGTKITMFDRTKKNIEDISYEDNLLVWNFDDGRFDSAKPLWIMEMVKTPSVNILFSDGSKLGISGHLQHDGGHRIFNLDKGEFTYVIPNEHAPIGTRTFNDRGEIVTIVGKEEGEFAEIYNVVTNRHLNIFAEGMLTSRRLNNIYPIADMKFVKEERIITPIEEFNHHFFYGKGITEEYYNGLRLGEQPVVKVSEGFLTKSPGELAYTLPTIEELAEWTIGFIQKKYEAVYEDTIS
jgi:hypothetical protein